MFYLYIRQLEVKMKKAVAPFHKDHGSKTHLVTLYSEHSFSSISKMRKCSRLSKVERERGYAQERYPARADSIPGSTPTMRRLLDQSGKGLRRKPRLAVEGPPRDVQYQAQQREWRAALARFTAVLGAGSRVKRHAVAMGRNPRRTPGP